MYAQKVKWLKRYRAATRERKRLEDEQQQWRSLAEKVTPSSSQAPGGGSGPGRIVSAVEAIDEVAGEIAAAIEKQARMRREIVANIEALENEDQKLVLKYHYINGLSFEETAEEIGKSYSWVSYTHKAGVENLFQFYMVLTVDVC